MEKKEINDWTDVWFKPFHYDGYGYIWDADNTMTFTVDLNVDCDHPYVRRLINDIITILNGGEIETKHEGLVIKDGCDLYKGDTMIGYFRGWGHLTGSGVSALHLDEEKAGMLQDRLITYVMDKLRK